MQIIPYVSLGDFLLNSTRDSIRLKLNTDFRTIQNPSVNSSNDVYFNSQLHFEFDENDLCISIEVMKPQNALLFGHHLMNLQFEDALSLLSSLDSNLIHKKPCLISKKLGISLFFDENEHDIPVVSSVLIFKEGYFDSLYP